MVKSDGISIPNEDRFCFGGLVLEPFVDAIAPSEVSLLAVTDRIANNHNFGVIRELSRVRHRRGSPWLDTSSSRFRVRITTRETAFDALLFANRVAPAILFTPRLIEITMFSSIVNIAIGKVTVGVDAATVEQRT